MKRLILLTILTLAACGEPIDYDTSSHELAIDGAWVPDPDLVAQSQGYDIPYVGAGTWVGASGCGGSFLPGTTDFREWLYAYWPQVIHVGGYACRPIANSTQMSVHATGRAVDIHIPLDGGEADNDLGDPLANFLIEHAQEMGIQLVIWDRWIWSMGRDGEGRSRAYGGTHPHHDHLHVELTPVAADQNYPWWDTDMGPPELGSCGYPFPKEGGIVDNRDNCFIPYGPAQFWRTEEGGHAGDLRWTNAFETDEPSNWARWTFNVSQAGKYKVEYYSVPQWAVYNSTRYVIKHGETESEVTIDQSVGVEGWNELGEFDFVAGDDQWVAVYDNSAIPVEADQHIIADAMRIVRTDLGEDTEIIEEMEREEREKVDPPDADEGNEDDEWKLVDAKGGCSSVPLVPSLWILLMAVGGFLRRRF